MNILILTHKQSTGMQLRSLLLVEEVEKCPVVTTIDAAVNHAESDNVDCLFFERNFTEDLQPFFDRFSNPLLYYCVIHEFYNNLDAIDALNSGRVVGFVDEPFKQVDVSQSLKNLHWRMTYRAGIRFPPIPLRYDPAKTEVKNVIQ